MLKKISLIFPILPKLGYRNVAYIGWYRYSNYHGLSRLSKSQDKGHYEQFKRWTEMLKKGGEPIIPYSQVMNTSRAAVACLESLKTKAWIEV